ncbi:hypothetical protein BLA60_25870 [Actinophytocola xinjiangensis]|uniref:Uncharacterized protein n=1 Tax=Actinophytocola xinjiangensis TaxID=485602 RepID=A0A7Z0WI69_9PSEU|nr:hypothetical protein [Actinophytocola xinjiangensis]OLF07760.1 hypothetical protein BLA60_25870 [Actinophytocola xinjiangensis]
MALFAAGQPLTAQALNAALGVGVDNGQMTPGTTTSTSYVTALTSGSTCGTPFVAPTSGMVVIVFYGRLRNSGNNITLMSVRIGTGSTLGAGTAILSGSDDWCKQTTGTADAGDSAHVTIGSLTPGNTYNVVAQHRVNGGTGTFSSRRVTVIPV